MSHTRRLFIWFLPVFWLWISTYGLTLDPDISDLSLLPMHKLMIVKKSLKHDAEITTAPINETDTLPDALPLRRHSQSPNLNPNRRGGPPVWVEEVEVWKGGGQGHSVNKDKLSTIFQGTVTTLAFLAFGGYLLCLVLHVLREKKTALTMTLLTTTAPGTRRRRGAAMEGRGSAEEAYVALRRLAEGYARYSQVHAKHQEL